MNNITTAMKTTAQRLSEVYCMPFSKADVAILQITLIRLL
jgi:hypothetical protein